jgi:hypothetical protein
MVAALENTASDVEISVLASSRAQLNVARQIIGHNVRCHFHLLEVPPYIALLDALFSKVAPFKRVAMLKYNLDIFEKLDALVVPERTSLLLKQKFGLTDLKMVRVCHGAGDRDVAWAGNIADFDYVMLPGTKHLSRMLEMGLVRPDNSAVIGYMKLDTLKGKKPQLPFKDERPTVVYNPHFDPHLSSWHNMGLDVLEQFADNDDYNLIFAPHIMLFQRRIHTSLAHKVVRWRKDLSKRFLEYDNILVDTSSAALNDMTYTRAADIYLGDVSSQVYEFIANPRPCVFLNSHTADWKDNPLYKFWKMGPVVENVDDLFDALKYSTENQSLFRMAQIKLFRDSIDLQDTPSANRAADALLQFLGAEHTHAPAHQGMHNVEPARIYG